MSRGGPSPPDPDAIGGPPRSDRGPCSPRTHEMASTTLDLPEPLGPTTQVIPGSSFKLVAEAKDLKPFTVRVLRCTNLRCLGERRLRREGTVRRVCTLVAAHFGTRNQPG